MYRSKIGIAVLFVLFLCAGCGSFARSVECDFKFEIRSGGLDFTRPPLCIFEAIDD